MGEPKQIPWWHGLAPTLVLPAAVVAFMPASAPPWVRMWVMAVAVFTGCKWLTLRQTPAPAVSLGPRLGYLFLWPGLDAAAFLTGTARSRPTHGEWLFATAKLLVGIILLWWVYPALDGQHWLVRGWAVMVGFIFLCHFGSFHLLSCAWRSVGVDAKPLMNWPVRAVSGGLTIQPEDHQRTTWQA